MNPGGNSVLLAVAGNHKRKWLKPLLKGAGLLVLLLIVWLAYAFMQVNSERSGRPSTRAGVGIVLGAALWNDTPSPGLEERLDRAVQDYRDGYFEFIIVTGGKDKGAEITEAEGMAAYLEAKGIPENAILPEDKATSTYENLLYSKSIMEERGLSRAILITHDFHGRRALEIARTLGYEAPKLSLVHTQVLNETYYTTREVLAYTKWKLQQIGLMITGA